MIRACETSPVNAVDIFDLKIMYVMFVMCSL